MTHSALIEALLFSRAEPWTITELSKTIGINKEEALIAIEEIETSLQNRGLVLIKTDETFTLGTHPEAHTILEKIFKEELSKGLSKASIETLSIVMYGTEITRGKIDYIRGVNSGFILRALLMRGLIERKPYPRDRKSFMYIPTVSLLASLGINKIENLPDYERIHGEIDKASIGGDIFSENNGDIQ